jgi:hypothetical protein
MEQESTNTVAAELLAMSEADQAMRDAYQTTNEWDSTVDEVNTARLKEIIEQRGWPTISLVGKKGASAAWLLAQHADKDPAFQEKCLELMKQLPESEVVQWNIALFEDRVRMNTGRPQLYGTQFRMSEGNFGPGPIEDEEHLEERRMAMGLESFEEYSRGMHEMYEEHQASITK